MSDCRRISMEQKWRLIEIVEEKHATLLLDKFFTHKTRHSCRNEWTIVGQELNALIGVQKTGDEWRECFTNMTLRVRKKLQENQKERIRSAAPQLHDISEMDEKIIAICGISIIDGKPTSTYKDGATPRLLSAAAGRSSQATSRPTPPHVARPPQAPEVSARPSQQAAARPLRPPAASGPAVPVAPRLLAESYMNSSIVISSIQKEDLTNAYHSARLAKNLSHSDAVRSPDFWTHIQTLMSQRGHNKTSASLWMTSWHRMQSALLKRIDTARDLQRTDSSWLTPLNKLMLTVMLELLDEKQLDHVEMCMANEIDRMMVCATIYQDFSGERRYVMKCHRCSQTFSEADKLMDHIRRYAISEETADLNSDDDDPVLVIPRTQPVVEIGSSDDEIVDPTRFGFVTDDDNSDCNEAFAKDDKQHESTQTFDNGGSDNRHSSDASFEEFLLKLKTIGEMRPEVVAVQPTKCGFATDDGNRMSDWQHEETQMIDHEGDNGGNSNEVSIEEFLLNLKTAGGITSNIHCSSDSNDEDTIIMSENNDNTTNNVLSVNLETMSHLKLPCTIEGCLMRFPTNVALNKHTMSIHNRKAYQCTICPVTLRSEHLLAVHIRGHERRFQCDICKKFYANRGVIISHMVKHQNIYKYKCQDCDKHFQYPTARNQHWQKIHGGGIRKPYVCDQCGLSFCNKSNLLKHKILHGAERPFKCDLCDSTFRSKSYVRRHIQRLHTNEKPFKCRHEGCEEHFRNYDTRVRHEVRVHGKSCAPSDN